MFSKAEAAREIGCFAADNLERNEHDLGGSVMTSQGLSIIKPGATARKVATAIHSAQSSLEEQLGLVAERYVSKLEYLVLASDFLTGVDRDVYRHLANYTEIVAVQVRDPWDWALPNLGEIRVAGEVYDTSNSESRQAYTDRANEQQNDLFAFFREIGATHYEFRTDKPLEQQVITHFSQRQLRRAS